MRDDESLSLWTVDGLLRPRQVKKGSRGVIVGSDTLMVDLLRKQGAEVYTAEGRDGDDIVALLAHHAGPQSFILSADRDMFRCPYDSPG